jgi:hypothetical protein
MYINIYMRQSRRTRSEERRVSAGRTDSTGYRSLRRPAVSTQTTTPMSNRLQDYSRIYLIPIDIRIAGYNIISAYTSYTQYSGDHGRTTGVPALAQKEYRGSCVDACTVDCVCEYTILERQKRSD